MRRWSRRSLSGCRQRSLSSRLRGEALEPRTVLAAVAFGPQQLIDQADADGADRVTTADLDGDGDLDAVVTSYRDHRVAWFENRVAGGYLRHAMAEDANEARDVVAADLDGDADLDVVVAAYGEDAIRWYENDGHGQFAASQIVTANADGVRALAVADLDQDGDLDLVSGSWFTNTIDWYANDGHGAFANPTTLSTQYHGPRSLQAVDVNGDHLVDIVAAARVDDKLFWFSNQGGGSFSPPRVIASTGDGPESIALGDLDHDGDADLVVAFHFDGQVAWFENADGAGGFGAQQSIATSALQQQSVAIADVDGDGDQDVLAGAYRDADNQVSWFPNADGQGTFGNARRITQDAAGVQHVTAADMNRDGRTDVLTASAIDNKVTLFTNADGLGNFNKPTQILSDANGPADGLLVDLDGDDDLDILAASYWDNKIVWYENQDGRGQFAAPRQITDAVQRVQSTRAADLDGDGDLDVLSASYRDGKIAWYENTDGRGLFGPQRIITDRLNGPVAVLAADLDGDGDLDVASASAKDAIIAWYANSDGDGNFGTIQVLTRRAVGAEWLSAADVDQDGDLDLMTAAYEDGEVKWFDNRDGAGHFSAAIVLTSGGGPTTVEPIDLDGDGDLDLASTRYDTAQLVWLENLGGGKFGAAQLIAENLTRVESLHVADIDGNGQSDLVAAGDGFVAWIERLADGTFAMQIVTTQVVQSFSAWSGDINRDGTIDLLSVSFGDNKVAVYFNQSQVGDFDADGHVDAADIRLLCLAIRTVNPDPVFDLTGDTVVDQLDMDQLIEDTLHTTYGDSNLDGVFDSQDLVTVFIAGQYEDEVADNSTWSEGDWDCDGEFTTLDLVLAFQRGAYS